MGVGHDFFEQGVGRGEDRDVPRCGLDQRPQMFLHPGGVRWRALPVGRRDVGGDHHGPAL